MNRPTRRAATAAAISPLRISVVTGAIALLAVFAAVAGACPGAEAPADSARGETATTDTTPAGEATVIAYYFHQTIRCFTCLTMEAYAKETLETHFATALADSQLVWLPLNTEEEGNEHFVEDFQLVGSALVLVRTVAGEVVAWQDLLGIWDRVDDRDGFVEYVRENVAKALEGKIKTERPD